MGFFSSEPSVDPLGSWMLRESGLENPLPVAGVAITGCLGHLSAHSSCCCASLWRFTCTWRGCGKHWNKEELGTGMGCRCSSCEPALCGCLRCRNLPPHPLISQLKSNQRNSESQGENGDLDVHESSRPHHLGSSPNYYCVIYFPKLMYKWIKRIRERRGNGLVHALRG